MVELQTKLTKTGVLYVPKEIRECFSREMKIITNATAALFFPANADYEDVLGSLEVIKADIEHRISLQKKRMGRLEGG